MLKIRLAKIGKKNAPAFKIVVANTRDKRNGRSLDVLGHFNPSHKPELFEIDKDKYEEWISKGAQVTDAVKDLVAGEYKFEPYTRQNEEEKKPAETEGEDAPAAEGGEAEGENEEEKAEETAKEASEE